MAQSALGAAQNLLGCGLVLALAPAVASAQDEAIVRVSATVIAPRFLAPQISAAQAGMSIAENLVTADQGTDRAAAQAGNGVMVSFAVATDEPTDEGRASQREAEPADPGKQTVVRVTVAYASN